MSRARFTAWGDEAVERFVGERVDRIVAAVAERMGPDLEAVLLAGGFGRGEGSVLRRADGSFHVVNDFDFELVYREPFGPPASKLWVHLRHRRGLQALAERFAREMDMKQVDLSLRAGHTLAAATPRLADYDLRHGHHLLWGASDPCQRMPAYAAADIPAHEGAWLLRNRGIGLLLARLYLDHGFLDAGATENFYVEINKAALAMGDALWIVERRYDVQYATRAAAFETLRGCGFGRFDELAGAYRQAAEYKLRPVEAPYPSVSMPVLWARTASLYREFFLWFEQQRLGQPFGDLADYARHVLAAPGRGAGPLRRWLDRRIGASGECPPSMRGLKYLPSHSIVFVAALVAERVDDAVAADVLSAWPVAGTGAAAWTARARGLLALLHPGGEVGRFLGATRGADRVPLGAPA
jgi:hypothetical protein